MRRFTILSTLLLALGLVAPAASAQSTAGDWQPTTTPDTATWVVLESTPGDYVGGGEAYAYTPDDAVIEVASLSPNHEPGFQVRVDGDEWWNGSFEVPAGTMLDTGLHDGATRHPFNADTEPGLSWSGEGRGCNDLHGWFAVDGFELDAEGDVSFLLLRFEQYCGNATVPLRGAVRYDAGDATGESPNPRAVPDGLWSPDADLLPDGDAPLVVLASTPGDYIGQGATSVYEGDAVAVTAQGNRAQVRVDTEDERWRGDFAPADADLRLEVGFYDDLRRHPFHNPMLGGLDWSGNGRGCNELTGWFVVDEVGYAGDGTLERLSLRFEQWCGASSAPLRGHVALGIDRGPGDVEPPTVAITSGPDQRSRDTSATVTFVADEPATFSCRLDDADPVSCTSPWTVDALGGGDHVITVVGTDAAGNRSAPATWTWEVKGGGDKGGGKGGGPKPRP